jgi:hypothetical protein
MRLHGLLALFLLGSFAACVHPPPPAERASDAARELNVAARFGEMTTAAGRTAEGVRTRFLERRAGWGKSIRIVDVELAGLTMSDHEHATVMVDYSWTRMDSGTLMATRVVQEFRDDAGTWRLTRERRLSGDTGLFGEPGAFVAGERRPDVQFETKVIH